MEQNEKEWHEWRRQGLGASDLPIIMGDSPYKTAFELWLDKTGQAKEEKNKSMEFILRKGHDIEVIARNKYEILTGKTWEPILVEHQQFKHFRASLDGYNKELNECWECKYIGKEGFEEVRAGKVPQKYKAQVQWQLMVSGAKRNHFVCMNDTQEMVYTIVERDEAYMEKLVDAALIFWKKVVDKTPPALSNDDKVDLAGTLIADKLLAYNAYEQRIKTLMEKTSKLKKEIFEMVPHGNCFFENDEIKFSVQKVKRQGAVNWPKLAEKYGISKDEQELNRKRSSTSNTIRIREKNND